MHIGNSRLPSTKILISTQRRPGIIPIEVSYKLHHVLAVRGGTVTRMSTTVNPGIDRAREKWYQSFAHGYAFLRR
jgi:hypothetical protein